MLSNFDSSRATRQRGPGIAFDDTLNNPKTRSCRVRAPVAAVPDELAIVTNEISLTYRALEPKGEPNCCGVALAPPPT